MEYGSDISASPRISKRVDLEGSGIRGNNFSSQAFKRQFEVDCEFLRVGAIGQIVDGGYPAQACILENIACLEVGEENAGIDHPQEVIVDPRQLERGAGNCQDEERTIAPPNQKNFKPSLYATN